MKIVLIDDHEIFRLGLHSLLQSQAEIEIVGEAGDGETGIKLVAQLKPDIVVLDYSMPGLSGLELLSTIKQRHVEIGVILLTASKSESVLSEAMQASVDAVVLKQDTGNELVQAIETVGRKMPFISSSITPLMARFDVLSDLTKRERQVLRLIANGYRNREIGEQLNISLKTVDSHRTNLMRKLDIHNLVDLIELANKTGLCDQSI